MSDIIFNEEKDFEEAVIKALIEHGWESDVIRYPSEEDLIQNWANILFNNNKQGTRLNDQPLTSGEMAQILDQVRNLQSPRVTGMIRSSSVVMCGIQLVVVKP